VIPNDETGNDGAIELLRSFEITIDEDLPLMIYNSSGNGLHHVLRTIFAYIETFGYAYGGEKNDSKTKIEFIKKYFGDNYAQYKNFGGIFYSTFRHSLVHNLKPQHLFVINNDEYYWSISHSEKRPAINSLNEIKYDKNVDYSFFTDEEIKYRHLHFVRIDKSKVCFPISVDQLYLDLKTAITGYLHDLESNNDTILRHNARKAMETVQTCVELKSISDYQLPDNPSKDLQNAYKRILKINPNTVCRIDPFPDENIRNLNFDKSELETLKIFLDNQK